MVNESKSYNTHLYNYAITDLNGRVVSKGILSQGVGSISVSTLNPGMYFLQYINDRDLFTEKFMKQ